MKKIKVTLKYEVEIEVEDAFVDSADYCSDLAIDKLVATSTRRGVFEVLSNFDDMEFETVD